jgi:integrase
MVEEHIRVRAEKAGNSAANSDITYLKALFFHAVKKSRKKENKGKYVEINPVVGIERLPMVEKPLQVLTYSDIDKVIDVGNRDQQDFLTITSETMARSIEVYRLEWDMDIDLVSRTVALNTRKRKGGDMEPRKIPMTDNVYEVLSRRHAERDPNLKWVFWRRYYSRKEKKWVTGPWDENYKFMDKLCQKAGVKYFRYHPLRHAGASTMDNEGVPLTGIQYWLGHKHATTTDKYLHRIKGVEKRAMEIFQRARKSHTESHMEQKRGSV